MFTIYQGKELIKRSQVIGDDWNKIKYTNYNEHGLRTLTHKYIPQDATLLLVVYAHFKDYLAFGPKFGRTVIQLNGPYFGDNLNTLIEDNSDAYIIIEKSRFNLIEADRKQYGVALIDPKLDKLFIEDLINHPLVKLIEETPYYMFLHISSENKTF